MGRAYADSRFPGDLPAAFPAGSLKSKGNAHTGKAGHSARDPHPFPSRRAVVESAGPLFPAQVKADPVKILLVFLYMPFQKPVIPDFLCGKQFPETRFFIRFSLQERMPERTVKSLSGRPETV